MTNWAVCAIICFLTVAKMTKVYIVMALGFGDDEDCMYNMGVYSTRKKAEAHEKEILEDMYDAVVEIEEWKVDA